MTESEIRQLRQSVNRIGAWRNLPFFSRGCQFSRVCEQLRNESGTVLPNPPDILRAFQIIRNPRDVRVVILGQDPYPNPNRAHATGLAFATRNDEQHSTMTNIISGVKASYPTADPNRDLIYWAEQGVLLLNCALTVPKDAAGCHLTIGWKPLIDQVLACLSWRRDIAWMLWGGKAQKIVPRIASRCVIKTSHPQNQSVSKTGSPFRGSRQFRRVNQFLRQNCNLPIDWKK